MTIMSKPKTQTITKIREELEIAVAEGHYPVRAQDQTTSVWVLAYILRFPNKPGEWAQVVRTGYTSEALAEAARIATGSPDAYQICKIEVQHV
jgi:hypothetical protein